MMGIQIIYVANILVAGAISISCLWTPKQASVSVFSNAFVYSEVFRLVGALWGAICILSILGLFYPLQMSAVLLLQFIYKATWLLVGALPAYRRKEAFPKPMAWFFLVWVLVLPCLIPWKYLFYGIT